MFAKKECVKTKLCPFSLGIALGVASGLFLMLFAWAGHLWHYGLPLISQIATIFYGYAPTVLGGLYGALWGLLEGFIFGFIVALVYDFCICCCCTKTSMCNDKDMKIK